MTQKKSRTQIASAVSLALASMMLSASVNAGVIDNTNNAPAVVGACGADTSDQIACVGAWNLSNVQVNLIRVIDGTIFDTTFDEVTGAYVSMTVGDSFRSLISDGDDAAVITGRLSGKDWPVGEPTGIKAVNQDPGAIQKADGSPVNCLINTSYEGELVSSTGADAYLDIAASEPVICSSGFQSHKRFKAAMLPAAADGVGKDAIDLVFNVDGDTALNPYQVFSKINNYTDKRLAGFKIQVGRGIGSNFQTASDLNIADQLYLSLGIGEETKLSNDMVNLFDLPDGLANFSHGLFGPVELPHFPAPGFFDDERAYYPVGQRCETAAGAVVTCTTNVSVPSQTGLIPASDTIYSSGVLSANYTAKFGDWLPSIWAPKGLFTPDPVDPTADPILQAWWNGTNWIKYDTTNNYAEVVLTSADIQALVDKGATIDVIEDVLNLGPNYIVKVGNINTTVDTGDDTFTVRIIPVVSANQTQPAWVSSEPPALPAPTVSTPTTTTTSGGGGCAVGGNGRFDPTLPALLAMGLGFFGWRRFKAGK